MTIEESRTNYWLGQEWPYEVSTELRDLFVKVIRSERDDMREMAVRKLEAKAHLFETKSYTPENAVLECVVFIRDLK